MTIDHGAAEAAVKIRTSRHDWVMWVVVGGLWFVLPVLTFAFRLFDMSRPQSWSASGGLVFAFVFLALGLSIRTYGVDLTPESANLLGSRRRSVPWKDVQAVVKHRQLGAYVVRLNLESGKPVTLAAPTTFWGLGAAEYERDFHRIGQWWLAHRGESWRPVPPAMPQLPDQG